MWAELSPSLIALSVMALFTLLVFIVQILLLARAAKSNELIAAQQIKLNELAEKNAFFQHEVLTGFSQISKSQQYLLESSQKHYHQSELKLEQLMSDFKMRLLRQITDFNSRFEEKNGLFQLNVNTAFAELKQQSVELQLKSMEQLVAQINQTAQQNRDELAKSVLQSSEQVAQVLNRLSDSTDHRLKEISGQVEKRLAEGFEKTTKTFNDILQRLALIDDAQKKITELSSNVVSLQEVLADKRSRGAFGEVQLNALVKNVLPPQHISIQHTLSNGKIADCVLKLPEPTGNIVIDAKFPLESYKRMLDEQLTQEDRKLAERQFKLDIKKHVNDIADKYLIEGETADGAVMFIPAEAIFAEIHAHHPELVSMANQKRVWLTSPTTLMAVLTTARSVLKDEATRKQVHIIQQHLMQLSNDFARFRGRFDNLAKHIDQAALDVKQIHTSANKISDRFEKIENVDLLEEPLPKLHNKAV